MGMPELAIERSSSPASSALRWSLERLGARLFEIDAPPSPSLRSAAVLAVRGSRRRALLAAPFDRDRDRRFADSLALAGLEVEAPPDAPLDGRDALVLHDGHGALLGHGFRTGRAAARSLERFLDAPVLPLELADPALPQLSMVVAVLADGTALVCEAGLRPRSLAALRDHPAVRRLVRVPRAEALRGALQLLELDDAIVTCSGAYWLGSALGLLGRAVLGVRVREKRNEAGCGPASFAVPLPQTGFIRIVPGAPAPR